MRERARERESGEAEEAERSSAAVVRWGRAEPEWNRTVSRLRPHFLQPLPRIQRKGSPFSPSDHANSPRVRSSNGSERPSDASRMLPFGRRTIRKAHRPAGHCVLFRFCACVCVCVSFVEVSETVTSACAAAWGLEEEETGRDAEKERDQSKRCAIDGGASKERTKRKTIRFRLHRRFLLSFLPR